MPVGISKSTCTQGDSRTSSRGCAAHWQTSLKLCFSGLVWHVVAEEGSRESVDAKCRRLTATWVRERHVSDHDIEVCDFYEQLERAGAALALTGQTV